MRANFDAPLEIRLAHRARHAARPNRRPFAWALSKVRDALHFLTGEWPDDVAANFTI